MICPSGGQQPLLREPEEGGQELAASEVAGRADQQQVLRFRCGKAHDGCTRCPPNSLRRAAIMRIAKASSSRDAKRL